MVTTGSAVQSAATRARPDQAAFPATGTPPQPKTDGVRDTIESIVVAFILAFVFRAFVVEAFVIPTGSMAPGLYGKHAEHRCALCSYPFVYGIRDPHVSPRGEIMQEGTLQERGGFNLRCPNCGWTGAGNERLNSSAQTAVVADGGDRILVLKWPYDLGGELLGPKRWDVVVFKDPQDSETNFIKRLLGLPGEVLQLINGDLYAARVEAVPQDVRDALSQPPPKNAPDALRLTREQQKALAQVLNIRRKTRVAQESLWMLHYDHDFQPDLRRAKNAFKFDPPRWQPVGPAAATAWDASTSCVRFNPNDDQEHVLALEGRPIQDNYGYNDVGRQLDAQRASNVGDVRLSFVLVPKGTAGSITLSLRKGPEDFRVKLSADGLVRLDRLTPDGIAVRPTELARKEIEPLKPDEPVSIEFENVDYRVALSINGAEVVATTDAQYAPDILGLLDEPANGSSEYDKARVAIAARGMPLEIRHVQVHRDVYYRSEVRLDQAGQSPASPENPYAGYPGWGTERNPILLRSEPPDYFCCGDNSPQSQDARLWTKVSPVLKRRQAGNEYQHGTVPGDQMIGRAFFVYWPGGLRFSASTYAVIPNMGRMRIIR